MGCIVHSNVQVSAMFIRYLYRVSSNRQQLFLCQCTFKIILLFCIIFLFSLGCSDGDVRLMNDGQPSAMEGIVEICFNNTYGTVCNDKWDRLNAGVVCRQLGYNGTLIIMIIIV